MVGLTVSAPELRLTGKCASGRYNEDSRIRVILVLPEWYCLLCVEYTAEYGAGLWIKDQASRAQTHAPQDSNECVLQMICMDNDSSYIMPIMMITMTMATICVCIGIPVSPDIFTCTCYSLSRVLLVLWKLSLKVCPRYWNRPPSLCSFGPGE
jgi:hypothetical protein